MPLYYSRGEQVSNWFTPPQLGKEAANQLALTVDGAPKGASGAMCYVKTHLLAMC